MKAVAVSDPVAFKPVLITITIESPEELGAMYAMFNFTAVINATVGSEAAIAVREAITKANGGKWPNYQTAHGALTKLIEK